MVYESRSEANSKLKLSDINQLCFHWIERSGVGHGWSGLIALARYMSANPRDTSDLTDHEWQLVEPYMPPPSHTGRSRKWPLREIVNAILYIASYRIHRLSMGNAAEEFSAVFNGSLLVLQMAQ